MERIAAAQPALLHGAEYVVEAPRASREAVEALFPGDFPGKEALIHFYTEVGGGLLPRRGVHPFG
jgi:hypothetical protein